MSQAEQTPQTSRSRVLDGVEMIGQLLALNSHLQEICDSYWKSDEVSDEELESCKWMIRMNNSVRRGIMDKIKTENSDHKRWCAVKHSIFAYELSCEVMYANVWDEDIANYQSMCAENMYNILSRFLWLEVTLCWRCINDELLDTSNESYDNNNNNIIAESSERIAERIWEWYAW